MLRYLTAGESHGESMTVILDGMPSGLRVDNGLLKSELKMRQSFYGRGKRMKIEPDIARISSGLRKGVTIGSPISILIRNKDFSIDSLAFITKPRPGHADLAGAMKYGLKDIRSVLERSSARDTVSRVAIGALCKQLLMEFDIDILSHVVIVGGVIADTSDLSFKKIRSNASKSPVNCADGAASKRMIEEIDRARLEKDTLGGVFEIIVKGVPVGLGSYSQSDRRLNARLCGALSSIQAVKAVEVGAGFDYALSRGSEAHDEIFYSRAKGFYRSTNRAGGIEGGMSNGEDIVLRACMKPIPTLMSPLSTVDTKNKKAARATVERSDVCAVGSCGVVGEAAVAIEIA
ncbi:MAG: chorismate synthase, partial [Candidatus Omnitrophica bacterium CG1_02_49_10]